MGKFEPFSYDINPKLIRCLVILNFFFWSDHFDKCMSNWVWYLVFKGQHPSCNFFSRRLLVLRMITWKINKSTKIYIMIIYDNGHESQRPYFYYFINIYPYSPATLDIVCMIGVHKQKHWAWYVINTYWNVILMAENWVPKWLPMNEFRLDI